MTKPKRCEATNARSGRPCRNPPVQGQALCKAHGGTPPSPRRALRDDQQPLATMLRARAVAGDSPRTERWVTVRPVRVAASDAYAVVVVDGRNVVTDWRLSILTPDITKACIAANRLYNRIAKED
jgi:hypothetical protein